MMSRATALLLAFVGACAGHVAMPILASDLAEPGRGKMLSAYLGQRDASAAVCDLNARGPHLAVVDADVRNVLMKGLREGRVDPALWRQCVENVVRSTDPDSSTLLLDDVAHSYEKAVTNTQRDTSSVRRLAALHSLLVDPHSSVAPHREVSARVVVHLRAALVKGRLDSLGIDHARQFITGIEVTLGLRDGRPVGKATLDSLSQAKDESSLRQYALRLPDTSLRSNARRRVILLDIAQSPYREVREDAAAVEERLMQQGVNAVAVADRPVLRGWIDEPVRTARVVLVRQDVERQTSTLVGSFADDSAISVLPQLSMRGALHLQLEGLERPVTLCGPPEDLDPSPCVPASAIKLNNPLAYLEPDGAIRFVDRITASETFRLATREERFVVPVTANGQQLAALDWALRFETPNEFVLTRDVPGAVGPDLRIRLEVLAGDRLSYSVSRGGRGYVAIVERGRWRNFDVLSRGSAGTSGSDGSSGGDGSSGLPGSNATCPSSAGSDGGRGEDGASGGDGGSGGNGGDGGNVLVEIHAQGALADSLRSLVHWTVASRGGHGGSGGSGGRGGRGGSGGTGGSGATCFDADGKVTSLSGGFQGLSGSDGRNGSPGMSGSEGRSGTVTVRVIE